MRLVHDDPEHDETTSPAAHPADRLIEVTDAIGAPVCVGLDPVIDRLPDRLRPKRDHPQNCAVSLAAFSKAVIDLIADRVGVVKIQIACFERYGTAGLRTMDQVVQRATEAGMVVIFDAKRGDIGISAAHYAAAFPPIGWVTVNGYFGGDGLTPFLDAGHGAFALVRTSNPTGDDLQTLPLKDGRTVAEAVGGMVAAVGGDYMGDHGYSALGAVVGATKAAEVASLRAVMPHQLFLMPGYGAQGAGPDDIREAFDTKGHGAVVTASRSIIYAYEKTGGDWRTAVREAAARFADDVSGAVG